MRGFAIGWALTFFAGAGADEPRPTDAEAWRCLPAAIGGQVPLPAWARTLAKPLPRTTAAMLRLELVHRTRSPLDPLLRARLRWAIADVNRCDATKAFAQADLERLGVPAAELALLQRNDRSSAWERLSAADRHAVTFVRQLSLRGAETTDEQMKELLTNHGEKNAVAIVLLTAAGNFQDRLFHALGMAPETEPERLRPPTAAFDDSKRWEGSAAAPRGPPKTPGPPEDWQPQERFGAGWGAVPLETLRQRLEAQKARPARLRTPTAEEYVAAQRQFRPARQVAAPEIRWSRVCGGYQPELAAAWSRCMGSFAEDSRQDRVFEESLFWVITRASDCFY